MKAHINLLKIEERRNPGVMLLRTTVGTLFFVAVAAVVLYGLHAFVLLQDAQKSQSRADEQWRKLEADHVRAVQLQAEHATLERLTTDLAAFSNAQVTVAARLLALAHCMPPEVQLTEVAWSQVLVGSDGQAARQQELKITGRTASESSEVYVNAILASLKSAPETTDFGAVFPGGIRVDPQVENARVSIFEIRCVFAPRRFQ